MAFLAAPNRRPYPQSAMSSRGNLIAPSTSTLLQPSTTTSLLQASTTAHASVVQAQFVQGHPPIRSAASVTTLNESPYPTPPGSRLRYSGNDQYSLSPDPTLWGANLMQDHVEPDDELHNPDPRRDRKNDAGRNPFTCRGLTNLGCIIVLTVGLITLFAGYPLISHLTASKQSTFGGFNFGGINGSGQVPSMTGNWGLIDLETPQVAYTKKSFQDGEDLQLVFSDEFNTPGRSFYPGDDPYWEAADLHYWQTNNLEWYDPAAVTTSDGALEITLSRKDTHDLQYQGGMVTTWNKFCFTGGMIETSLSLPGINDVTGLWPAVWTLGNLGRAGYGASLEGLWPYTYDACDVGTAPNQTRNGLPHAATVDGDPTEGGVLSFLPGQRLSRCTCPGESHPGPVHADGTYVGRSAPEIDVLEAQVTGDPLSGQVSQSAQWAPFNAGYQWLNTSDNFVIQDSSVTFLNSYQGGVFQQATSSVTVTDQDCYQLRTGCYSVYGFEYKPGFDNAYIHWIAQDKLVWTIKQAGMGPDSTVQISDRPIPQEPMYIIANLGMSENFGIIDLEHLTFPAIMRINYIRIYQPKKAINIGCDPVDFPTEAYINQYIDAYTNPNLTTWGDDFGQPFPKNSFLGQC